ncbi:YicC/YloC family endoribonuclease [Epibacterium ulvae]|uniref:YicC/YloC family endoribonuclease n=1 Tax=Epibacterium ulvae TaxID=1156985 RepID=UPI0024924963|nr:YicC/YloC family endoribonuclease [Epibacterium ulvae]
MTIRSMTAFAAAQNALGSHAWSWEIRSVNAKGLDLRLRVPDWLDGLEQHLRSHLNKSLARGNVSLNLRITRTDDGGGQLTLNEDVLSSILSAMSRAERKANESGVALAPSTAVDLLAMRGVLDYEQTQDDPTPLVAALKKEFETLVAQFVQMREAEGKALKTVLHEQLSRIEVLKAQAVECVDARRAQMDANFKNNLAKIVDNTDQLDADRVAQELAILAVKADITEELDRLDAHVSATRDLLGKGGAIGRKLDFLMQEFNREANTLCSKAQNSDLTAIGLELKAVIDQMREQVQNIE